MYKAKKATKAQVLQNKNTGYIPANTAKAKTGQSYLLIILLNVTVDGKPW